MICVQLIPFSWILKMVANIFERVTNLVHKVKWVCWHLELKYHILHVHMKCSFIRSEKKSNIKRTIFSFEVVKNGPWSRRVRLQHRGQQLNPDWSEAALRPHSALRGDHLSVSKPLSILSGRRRRGPCGRGHAVWRRSYAVSCGQQIVFFPREICHARICGASRHSERQNDTGGRNNTHRLKSECETGTWNVEPPYYEQFVTRMVEPPRQERERACVLPSFSVFE